ncbi:MAG: 3-phosphoglycerate dehydrogenase [Crocinitomicaceae bacterium]|nr:3-phosphoglycerate dehydrogenase [Crocinitomicaceae bacterium]|tara:strand:+ start:2180 stop:3136 length:957 start_codon:yes stop_codon:yes gene_type:complete
MKVLANDGISKSGVDKLESNGFEVITNKVNQEDLVNYINENSIEVILVRSATQVRKDIIDHCKSVKIIGRGGVGMDNIDVEYARKKGLTVINTPAASSQSVAELVMAHLFSISRFVFDSNRKMPINGAAEFKVLKKKYGKGIELRGKNLGIIGFGRIGQFTAKYALGAGMDVLAYDPFIDKTTIDLKIANQEIEVPISTCSLEKLLKNSDFISLHVPMPKDGQPLISTNEFNSMKKGMRIVNASRGGVLNESALEEAIKNEIVSFAALDVFVGEPYPNESLLKNEKISLTPHIGAATSEAQDRIGTELADKIINFYNQ